MKALTRLLLLSAALFASPLLAGPHFEQQLIPRDGAFSIAQDDEWLIVGVPLSCQFFAYKFDYATRLWGDGSGTANAPFQEVDAPGNSACPSADTRGYGEVVSISGNLLIVGAPEAKGPKAIEEFGELGANLSGAVFAYTLDDNGVWVEISTGSIEARDSDGELKNQNGARFGAAVSISGDVVIIGAPTNGELNGPNVGAGEVYPYRYNPDTQFFEQLDIIVGPNDQDQLGFSVTASGDRFLLGAPGYDIGVADDVGAAILYAINPDDSIEFLQTIEVSEAGFPPNANDSLGTEVSLSDTQALLAGSSSFPAEPVGEGFLPKFEYERADGADVSQSEGVSAFGIQEIGVDIYPDVLNDNADQRSNYHLEIDLTGPGTSVANGPQSLAADGDPIPLLATDIRIYKDNTNVNDLANNQVRSLMFPCGYGAKLVAFEWSLVSIPCQLPPGTTVEQAFNADIFPGACDPECGALGEYGVNWEVWGQPEDLDDFTSGRASTRLEATDPVETGKAYWIISDASLKPIGQPVYWNVADSTSTEFTDLNGGTGGFDTLPENVGGYHEVSIDPDIPLDEIAKVMIGNPFPRAFSWENVGLSGRLFGTIPVTVPLTLAESVDPNYGIVGHLYNPLIAEGQPYDTLSTTPGFNNTVPENTGFWILIDSGDLEVVTDSILLPYEK